MLNKKGFSVVELSFVIIVTGILSLLAIPSFLDYYEKQDDNRIHSNIEALETLVNKRVIQDKNYLSDSDVDDGVYLVNTSELFLEEFKDVNGDYFNESAFGDIYAVSINLGYIEEDDVYIYSEQSRKVYHKKGQKPNQMLKD